MATTPDEDVVDQLDSVVGALTKGTNLFMGKVRAAGGNIPSKCVFVLATGGPPPDGYADGTVIERFFSGIQVRVRSSLRDFSGGQTLARSVRDALHHQAISGYIDVRVNESEPSYIGEDNEGHHDWAINLELWHEE